LHAILGVLKVCALGLGALPRLLYRAGEGSQRLGKDWEGIASPWSRIMACLYLRGDAPLKEPLDKIELFLLIFIDFWYLMPYYHYKGAGKEKEDEKKGIFGKSALAIKARS